VSQSGSAHCSNEIKNLAWFGLAWLASLEAHKPLQARARSRASIFFSPSEVMSSLEETVRDRRGRILVMTASGLVSQMMGERELGLHLFSN
jgi:hypothetical protein